MNSFFSVDNPLFTFLGKIFDVFVLSIIWFFCCLPVFTIGAATTALYYTSVKVIRRDRGYIFKEFWKSFRMNFVSGTIFTIILVALGTLFYLNITYAKGITGNLGLVLLAIYFMMVFFISFIAIYLFPLLSRFTMTRRQLVKTALFMSIKHLPTTIAIEVLLVAAVLIVYVINISIMLIPAAICLLSSYLMERILKKYMPEQEQEDSTKDTWYLE